MSQIIQNVYFYNPVSLTQLQAQVDALSSSFNTYSNSITFLLNGKQVTVNSPDPDLRLLDYLRLYTPFLGTKQGCRQGGCGICTVMLSYKDTDGVLKNLSVNSCLVKLVSINNLAITTIEALGNTSSVQDLNNNMSNLFTLHPIQQNFTKIGGLQCGYCTAGQIMNIYTSFQATKDQSNNGMEPTFQKTEYNQANNLCRCTGYRPIIESYKTLMVTSSSGAGSPYIDDTNAQQLYEYEQLWYKWHDPTGPNAALVQLPVYNPENDTLNATGYYADYPDMLTFPTQNTYFTNEYGVKYHSVVSMTGLYNVLISELASTGAEHVQIVQGQISYGIPGYYRPDTKNIVVNVQTIPDLRALTTDGNTVTIGAGVRISRLAEYLGESSSQVHQAMANHMNYISGWQNRNAGSWIGGVMQAKYGDGEGNYFQSDMTMLMLAVNMTLHVLSYTSSGMTEEDISLEEFLTKDYSGSVVVVTRGSFTITSNDLFYSYRTGMRIYNAKAVAMMAFKLTKSGNTVSNSNVWIGSIGGGINGYTQFTGAQSYMNSTGAQAYNPNFFIGQINNNFNYSGQPIPVFPDLVHGTTEENEATFRRQLLDGYCLQFVTSLQAGATGTSVPYLQKDTAWGTQEYGNGLANGGTGSFESIYQYQIDPPNLYPNTGAVHLKNYYPADPTKTCGEAKYALDYIPEGCSFLATINGGTASSGAWNQLNFTGAGYGMPYQEIDFESSQTLNAIENAKNMPGVKLVCTRLDIVPNDSLIGLNPDGDYYNSTGPDYYADNFLFTESVIGVTSFLNGSLGGFGQPPFFPVQNTMQSVQFSSFPQCINYIGQWIGFVVADTPDNAEKVARYISSNIAYKTPVNPGAPIIDAVPALTIEDFVDNNITYCRNSQFTLGPTLDGQTPWGNQNGSPATPSAAAIAAYTGIVGNFTYEYSGAQYKQTGAFISGNMDHFHMERHCAVAIPKNGKIQLIQSAQAPRAIETQMDGLFTFGHSVWPAGPPGANTRGIWYSPSGPYRWTDGTLFWDKSKIEHIIPKVGGGFGGKYATSCYAKYVYIASRILNQPVAAYETYTSALQNSFGNGQSSWGYELGFDNTGKIKALNSLANWNVGTQQLYFGLNYGFLESLGAGVGANALGIGLADQSRNLANLFNVGAIKTNTVLSASNNPLAFASRSFRQAEGMYFANSLNQYVSHYLYYHTGAAPAGLSQFDVTVTNLISHDSPFVTTNGTSTNPTGAILNNFGIDQVYSTQQGYYSMGETQYEQLLYAINAKVYETYFVPGTVSFLYATGYAGPTVAQPNTGAAYNDTSARYPAIKALEARVAEWNSQSENRYNKLGLAVAPSTYTATQGWNVSVHVDLVLQANGQIAVNQALTDTGSGSEMKAKLTFANELWIDPTYFNIRNDISQAGNSGLMSAGSVIQGHIQRAAILAAKEFLSSAFDAINFDISSGFLTGFYGLVNVIPVANTTQPPTYTLTTATTGSFIDFSTSVAGITGTYSFGDYAVIGSSEWDPYNTVFLYTGAGNTGPSFAPTSFEPISQATQAKPTQADLAWIKNQDACGKDLQLLTLVRFAQQNAGFNWINYGAVTVKQKANIVNGFWTTIANGLLSGGPRIFNDSPLVPGGGGVPIVFPDFCFGSTLRNIRGEGNSYYSPYNPLYIPPGGFGPFERQGDPVANWRTNACILSLTKVDTLDGTSTEMQNILCVDLGQSAEPLTDILQMEGAYYYGKAYMIHEDKYWDKETGELLTKDTWEYKPGCSGNTPVNMSVLLLNAPQTIAAPENGTYAELVDPLTNTSFGNIPTLGTINKNKPISEIVTPAACAMLMSVREAIAYYRDQEAQDQPASSSAPNQRNAWFDTLGVFPLTINKVKLCCQLPNSV